MKLKVIPDLIRPHEGTYLLMEEVRYHIDYYFFLLSDNTMSYGLSPHMFRKRNKDVIKKTPSPDKLSSFCHGFRKYSNRIFFSIKRLYNKL